MFLFCLYPLRTNELLSHLQAERQRLLDEVQTLQQANETQKTELTKLKENVSAKDIEREAVEGSDRSAVNALENANRRINMELDELKRDHDLKVLFEIAVPNVIIFCKFSFLLLSFRSLRIILSHQS